MQSLVIFYTAHYILPTNAVCIMEYTMYVFCGMLGQAWLVSRFGKWNYTRA